MVTGRIGGADASSSFARASSDTYGQEASSAWPAASFMAKARHVGTPHSWQLVFGSSLKMSIPDRAILYLLYKI
jgi:hypothetical protein